MKTPLLILAPLSMLALAACNQTETPAAGEADATKAAAAFSEGHYLQVEVAGKLAATDQPELADRFLAFMQSEAFQSVIPTTNWMYPAKQPEAGLPAGYESLPKPEKTLLLSSAEAEALRSSAVQEWLDAPSE